MRLVRVGDGIRLLTVKTGVDRTDQLLRYADERVAQLAAQDLCGFVLKKDSPSCGMYRQLGILQRATVSETSQRLASTEPVARTQAQWTTATIERNRRAVRAFFEQENARDTAKLSVPVQTGFKDILRTFPDWHWDVVRIVGQGDSVVALVRASGTHQGVSELPLNGALLVGLPPTGKHFEVWHIHWFKLAEGRITADYRTRDDIGLYKQLGILPK